MKTEELTITINAGVKEELEFLFKSGIEEDIHAFESLEDMIHYILATVADGSRRPGDWERQFLNQMGIVPENSIFHDYRSAYGDTEKINKFKEEGPNDGWRNAQFIETLSRA